MYSENEKLIAKEKIKYFKILPNEIVDEKGQASKLRNYDYEPGSIIELRAGELERELLPLDRRDAFSRIFLKNMQDWDYRKPFNFYEWIQMQKPITFSEEGMCVLCYEIGDRILVGPWIKAKVIQLFASRKMFWDNREAIVNNCKVLTYLVKNSFLKNIDTDLTGISVHKEQEILDAIMKNCFKEMEDEEIYPFLYEDDFFRKAKIISATQELYESNYDEELAVPFYQGETWDITKNRELLLGILNQSFYEMLIRNAKEIRGEEKDRLFEEEFENRIKILTDTYNNTEYYQAIDDAFVTEKILELQKAGYNISFDKYNPEHSYANGNIKYFSCLYNYYEKIEQREEINQFAEELTDLETKSIFPEEFYKGRAYYQIKNQGNTEDNYDLNIQYCKCNPDNFYPDGSVKYFWIDYLGSMNDFEKRKEVLQFADELPTSIAIKLKRADELAEYQHTMHKKEEEQIKKFMKSSNFSKKYQKAIKKMRNGEKIDERKFAKSQIEENKKHLRQKRLNSESRVRKLSIDEMIVEMDDMAKNYSEYEDRLKDAFSKLYNREIDLDDVIQLLDDVILTEDDAKCIATAWPLMQRVGCITNEVMTSQQVQDLFPELYEKTEVNKKAAELVAKFFNNYSKCQKEQKQNSYNEKAKKLKKWRSEKGEPEL